MEEFQTNVARNFFRLNDVDKFFVDLHSLVGGKELPAGRALYVLHLEVHALHMGVQPVLVNELSRASLAGVGILLKMASQFFLQ